MKKLFAFLLLLLAVPSMAWPREWRFAAVKSVSETDVSGRLIRESITMHYTVETEDLILFLEYSFHPAKSPSDDSGKHSPPQLAINLPTKIAVEGHHAYILDAKGSEVKMHISKKIKK